MMLAEPRELPVVPVGVHGIFRLPHEHQMLAVGVVGRWAGQVSVEEDPELHVTPGRWFCEPEPSPGRRFRFTKTYRVYETTAGRIRQ